MRGIGKGVKEFKGGISDDGNNKKESESANTANKETSDKQINIVSIKKPHFK